MPSTLSIGPEDRGPEDSGLRVRLPSTLFPFVDKKAGPEDSGILKSCLALRFSGLRGLRGGGGEGGEDRG